MNAMVDVTDKISQHGDLILLNEDNRKNIQRIKMATLANCRNPNMAQEETAYENSIVSNFEKLPLELLLKILFYLTPRELGIVASVCRRFKDLVYDEFLWVAIARCSLVTNSKDANILSLTPQFLSSRDKVHISKNWCKGDYTEIRLITQNRRYQPQIHLAPDALWISWGNRIWQHPRFIDGTVTRTSSRVFKCHTKDITRFVVKNGLLVSGGLDRSLFGWNADSGEFAFAKRYCHDSFISAVDLAGENIVVSGSRDCTVKIWNFDSGMYPAHRLTVDVRDRIWSLSTDPLNSRVAVGSAGLGGVPSLHMFDLNTGGLLGQLGGYLRNGAGVLDILWQNEATFLSCGHDTCTRLWDIRTGQCVRKWEEPHDEAVYCLASDRNVTLLCGTARHGMVRLWDMRHSSPVQLFYARNATPYRSSPVYDIAFDLSNLYIALEQCVNLMSFNSRNSGKMCKIRSCKD